MSTVFDAWNEIILVNCANEKHIGCNKNNDIPVEITSF